MYSIKINISFFIILLFVGCSDNPVIIPDSHNYLYIHGIVDSLYNTTDSNQYSSIDVGNLYYSDYPNVNLKCKLYGRDTIDESNSNEACVISISYFIANTYYLYQSYGNILDTIYIQCSAHLGQHFWYNSTSIYLFTMKKNNWVVCRDLEITLSK